MKTIPMKTIPAAGLRDTALREAVTEYRAVINAVRQALEKLICTGAPGAPSWVELDAIYPDSAVVEISGKSWQYPYTLAADGTVMHGLALIYVLREETGVENFRIVQESLELTRVDLVVNAAWNQAAAARVRQGLRARLGQGVEVRLELHEQLPAEASGKHRYVMSRVVVG